MKILVVLMLSCLSVFAAEEKDAQSEYEQSIDAVVRGKTFYKSGHFEVTALLGLTPYETLVDYMSAGARLTWHISDHYGWEILDGHYGFKSQPSSFPSTTTVEKRLSNLQLVQLKNVVTSNFLLSPIYGKLRMFGSSVVHYDAYLVAGLGASQTVTRKYSWVSGTTANESEVAANWDPTMAIGIGLKLFFGKSFGVTLDLRDYLSHSTNYGAKSLRSNFIFSLGLSFYLPGFG